MTRPTSTLRPAALLLTLSMTTLAGCGSSGGGSSSASGSESAASAGTSAGTSAGAAAPAGLQTEGELSVCTDPEYPPMEYYENGTSGDPIGFDSEGAEALAALWGVEVTWVPTAFDGLMPALQAGRCDILWSALYLSEERLQVADGAPFMLTGPGLIVRTGTADITTAEELSGKTVAVQGGGANEQTLLDLSAQLESKGLPGLTVQAYPKTAETVAAVMNGKADALIETDVAVADMVGKSESKLEEVPDAFPTETTFGVFTPKGGELSAPVAEGLATLEADGTLTKIATKYGLDPANISTGA